MEKRKKMKPADKLTYNTHVKDLIWSRHAIAMNSARGETSRNEFWFNRIVQLENSLTLMNEKFGLEGFKVIE